MKALVAYLSQTGNTRNIAEAIFIGIDCEKYIMPIQEITNTEEYDIVFAGFSVINFSPSEDAQGFIFKFCRSKKQLYL